MENESLISIVLPCYNGEKYLAQSIQSCIDQEYQNWELILVNDCSTDNSYEIMLNFAKKDTRIKIINNEINLKLPASLNIGFKAALGEYLTWTSDDNYYLPNAFKELLSVLIDNNADAVYSGFYYIDENNNITEKYEPLEPYYMIYKSVAGASFLYRRSIHISLNGYNVNLFLVEDYDFWLRMYLNNFKIVTTNSLLYCYRRHTNSLTNSYINKILNATYKRVIRNYCYLNQFPYRFHLLFKEYLVSNIQYLSFSDLIYLFSKLIFRDIKYLFKITYIFTINKIKNFFRKIREYL